MKAPALKCLFYKFEWFLFGCFGDLIPPHLAPTSHPLSETVKHFPCGKIAGQEVARAGQAGAQGMGTRNDHG